MTDFVFKLPDDREREGKAVTGVEIRACTCANEFQDRLYGPGRRVQNVMSKDRKRKGTRCTVCGRETVN